MSDRSCAAFFVSCSSPCMFVNLSSWFRLLARPASILTNPASSAESRATTLVFLAACLNQVLGLRPASLAFDSIKNRSVSESRTISCAFRLTFLGGLPPLDLCEFCSMLSTTFVSFTESVEYPFATIGSKSKFEFRRGRNEFLRSENTNLLP